METIGEWIIRGKEELKEIFWKQKHGMTVTGAI